MAARVISPPLPPGHPKRVEFARDGRAVPCAYCGAVPTQPVEVVSSEYGPHGLKRRGNRADLCLDCIRRLGIMRTDRSMTSLIVNSRQERERDARRDARSEMQANQMSLFPDEHEPGNALTEG